MTTTTIWRYNYSTPTELYHHGILGMKWGIRRFQNKDGTLTKAGEKRRALEPTKLAKKSATKDITVLTEQGYSKRDAEAIAARNKKIRTAALIAGGVTVAVGAALAARYLYVENSDISLKAGAKVFHIDRKQATDLEAGRHLYTTIDRFDRNLYARRLNNPDNVDRIERTFQAVKDLKVPNPKKAEGFYKEFINDPKNSAEIREAFGRLVPKGERVDYKTFMQYAPYFSKGESFGVSVAAGNNPRGVALWKKYGGFIERKGFQGLLDTFDRDSANGMFAERPTILFDANSRLKEIGRRALKESSLTDSLPSVRQLSSKKVAIGAAISASVIGGKTYFESEAINEYRRKHPNSGMSDKDILKVALGSET